jgi:hypothetical protein
MMIKRNDIFCLGRKKAACDDSPLIIVKTVKFVYRARFANPKTRFKNRFSQEKSQKNDQK